MNEGLKSPPTDNAWLKGEWVIRNKTTNIHHCNLPTDGKLNDVWLCNCGQHWIVSNACDLCWEYGAGNHGGQHVVGLCWRMIHKRHARRLARQFKREQKRLLK
jgi:hypothetical protein